MRGAGFGWRDPDEAGSPLCGRDEMLAIEQIAYPVANIEIAKKFWSEGKENVSWSNDRVVSTILFSVIKDAIRSEFCVDLAFNYSIIPGREFELLQVISGTVIQKMYSNVVLGHVGYHIKDNDLFAMHKEIKQWNVLGFPTLQVSITKSHTGVTGRRYLYALVDTINTFGCLAKIIQRFPETEMDVDVGVEQFAYLGK